jgi:hypothetical protein
MYVQLLSKILLLLSFITRDRASPFLGLNNLVLLSTQAFSLG